MKTVASSHNAKSVRLAQTFGINGTFHYFILWSQLRQQQHSYQISDSFVNITKDRLSAYTASNIRL